MIVESICLDIRITLRDILSIGHITSWKTLAHQSTPYYESQRDENCRDQRHRASNQRCERVEKQRKKALLAVLIVGRLVNLHQSTNLKSRCDKDEDATECRKHAVELRGPVNVKQTVVLLPISSTEEQTIATTKEKKR